MHTVARPAIAIRAPAKLNLSLAVLGRRPDGYHDIESLMVPTSLADALVVGVAPLPGVRLRIHAAGELRSFSASLAEIPTDDRNLVCRAIHALAAAAGVEPALTIELSKAIPAGAGLGGGSSDAAAAIRAAARLWGLDWSAARLAEIGATVGSDVPWFFAGTAAIASGRGERIEPVPSLPSLAAVVAWPGVPLSTAAVYGAWQRRSAAAEPAVVERSRAAARLAAALAEGRWGDVWPLIENDLEPAARERCAEVDWLLTDLARAGAVQPRLTGSGSACFALTRTLAEARGMAARVRGLRQADGSPRWPLVQAVTIAGSATAAGAFGPDERE